MNTGAVLFSNNANSRLLNAVDGVSTSIRVEAGTGDRFPQPAGDGSNWFMVTIEDRRNNTVEICKCTGRSGDILNVTRAQEATTATAFAAGATVSNRLTAGTMETFFIFNGYSQTESDDRYVNTAGDTMTGPLVLPAAPTQDLQAATKKYVDDVSIDEAPTDGRAYGRSMVNWIPIGTGLEEAPTDGKVYARGELQWQETILKTTFDDEVTATDTDVAALNDRIDAMEDINTAQDNRMTAIEGVNSDQDSRLDTVEGKNNDQDQRLDAVEAMNGNQNSRLDAGDAKDTAQDNRMTAIEGVNTTQNTAIGALQSGLTTETTNRTNADNALQAQIDLRLTDAPSDGTTYGRRNGAWVQSGGGGTAMGEWIANTTMAVPPASGQWRANAAIATATHLYLSDTTAGGSDVSNMLTQFVQIGTKLYFQDKDDPARWFTCQVTSITDAGSYHDIGIVYLNGASTWTAQRTLVSIMASAAAGVTISDTPPANPKNADLWWESDTGRMFIYYGDADSSQWVQAAAAAYIQDNSYAKKTASTRNRVVNPTAQVSQENGGTAGTVHAYYPADQWRAGISGIVASTQRISLGAPSPEGTLTAVSQTATTAKASLAATDNLQITLPIEGLDVSDLLWGLATAKSVVLRFNAYCDQAGTFAFSIRNSANDRTYLASFTLAAATWTTITLVIPGDTTGTWLRDTGVGMFITFAYAVGSTYQGVAGWQAGNFTGIIGMSNGAAVANSRLIVTDVGLYADPENTNVAPRFEAPSFADDLARCMRYWQLLPLIFVGGYAGAGGAVYTDFLFPPMRVAPTTTINPPAYTNASGMTVISPLPSKIRLQVTITSAGNGYAYGDVKCSARLI